MHGARVDAGSGKNLNLELLLNQIGDIFKPDEEATENDESLQVALSAQVRQAKLARVNCENRGAAVHDRNVPKRNQEPRSLKQAPSSISKLREWYSILKPKWVQCARP